MSRIFASSIDLSAVLSEMISGKVSAAQIEPRDNDRLIISFDLEDQNPLTAKQIHDAYVGPALQAMANEINSMGPVIAWRPRHVNDIGVLQEIFEGAIPVLATARYKCRGNELAGRTRITLEAQVRAV